MDEIKNVRCCEGVCSAYKGLEKRKIIVFGFELWESENLDICRRVQLTRMDTDMRKVNEALWASAGLYWSRVSHRG